MEPNNSVVTADEAMVPFAIRGVMYGESLFETIRVREGRIFRLEAHVKRLQQGLKTLGWQDVSDDRIRRGIHAVLHDDRLQYTDVRLRCTLLRLNESGEALYVVSAHPYDPPGKTVYELGVKGYIASTRLHSNVPWRGTKFGFRAPYIAARAEAESAGAWEAILLNTDGFVADGAITNVHFVQDGTIYTPHSRYGALPGTAQATTREIAEAMGIRWKTGAFRPMQLIAADEVFLTNALIGVVPMTMINERVIGTGACGPITERLINAYNALVARQSVMVDT